jgi:hypothetical protein
MITNTRFGTSPCPRFDDEGLLKAAIEGA